MKKFNPAILKFSKKDYEELVERTNKMKDYDAYVQTLLEDYFGDDAKDEKVLKSKLGEFGVKDVDEFFEVYEGMTPRESYNDFIENDMKQAKEWIDYYSKVYDKATDKD